MNVETAQKRLEMEKRNLRRLVKDVRCGKCFHTVTVGRLVEKNITCPECQHVNFPGKNELKAFHILRSELKYDPTIRP